MIHGCTYWWPNHSIWFTAGWGTLHRRAVIQGVETMIWTIEFVENSDLAGKEKARIFSILVIPSAHNKHHFQYHWPRNISIPLFSSCPPPDHAHNAGYRHTDTETSKKGPKPLLLISRTRMNLTTHILHRILGSLVWFYPLFPITDRALRASIACADSISMCIHLKAGLEASERTFVTASSPEYLWSCRLSAACKHALPT